ncbi:hypothetical protein COUCH_00865 [Couchioplanes caeruleus]|uniref:hypothetical protein n=1 Tax=Couchioplanes caeruleus TaxID=56438 RepID=UPI0020C07BC1|nr:hypothetical protein [Couchioplanes caeruleus]UQU64949.1 hypothetical protein COUCH_00865 [Couchioplanes caeruleus]
MPVRVRQVLLLTTPVVRLVPWIPVAAATAVSVLALLPALAGAPAPASQIWGVRIAAVVLGAGASFAMVDPMAPLSVMPTPRWLRQWLRLTVVALPAAAIWAVLYRAAAASVAPGRLPSRDLALEAAVCGLAGLVGAAVAARRGHSLTAAVAGPATQGGLMVATLFLPAKYSAWPLPGQPQWDSAHDWWLPMLPVLAAALVLANREVWPWRLPQRSGAKTTDLVGES